MATTVVAIAGCGEGEDVSPNFEDRIPPGIELDASPRLIDVGGSASLAGVLTQGEERLGGRELRIERDPYPFDGGWVAAGMTTTDERGRFDARVEPDSNTTYRAIFGAGGETQSPEAKVFVEPRVNTSARSQGSRTVFETTLRHPTDISLAGATTFNYVATSREANVTGRLPFAQMTRVEQDSPGRSSTAFTVRGTSGERLTYRNCIKYPGDAGMGRPGTECSQSSLKLGSR